MLKTVLLYVMAFAYVAAGVNHFVSPDFYVAIMPPYLPAHLELVWISGIAEIALGLLLLWPHTRAFAAWGLIALLFAVFPANVHMALHPEQFDAPAWGLYLRLPFQALFVLWAWWYTRPPKKDIATA